MNRSSAIGLLSVALLALAVTASTAQHKGSGAGSGSGSGAPTPYAGHDAREISAFSDDEVRQHREGRGLGYARPGEVNGYPGPMHILELGNGLGLTPEQRAAITAVFERMAARAKLAGAAYMDAEKALDSAFKSGTADAPTVARLVRDADLKRAEFRLSHLDAHLEAAPILTAEQRQKYAELRGYKN